MHARGISSTQDRPTQARLRRGVEYTHERHCRAQPAYRRCRPSCRDYSMYDPLLRGDRPAPPGVGASVGAAPAVHRHRGRTPARGDAPEGSARRLARAAQDIAHCRGGTRRGARPAAPRRRRPGTPTRAAERGPRTSRPPARARPRPCGRAGECGEGAMRDAQARAPQTPRARRPRRARPSADLGPALTPPAKNGAPATMPESHVSPSPEGVPGAVTDPASILAEDLTFAGTDGTQVNGYLARPYLARPSDSNPADSNHARPGVIVIHEAMGLNEHIRDVCNRFAQQGYVTLGVDLYTREGGPPPMGDLQAMMARLFAMSDATVLGDLEGAADFLRAREDVTGKVGCIGFCMGGRYALLSGGSGAGFGAAVVCGGGFIDGEPPEERSTPERPIPPLELAEK